MVVGSCEEFPVENFPEFLAEKHVVKPWVFQSLNLVGMWVVGEEDNLEVHLNHQ